MDYTFYQEKLKGKNFIFKVGSYNNVGGAETKAITVAEILKDMGANVSFVAKDGNGDLKTRLDQLGIPTLIFPYYFKINKFRKVIQIIRQILFLRKLKPDFILPWSSDNCKAILPYWRFTGAKYAWWNMQDEGRGLYKTPFEKKLMLEATDIISNSLAGKEFITESYGINPDNIVLYNNPTYVPDKNSIKKIWREKLGVDSDTLVVSMLANIIEFKDHKTLVKSWKMVADHFNLKGKKVMLLLAGRLEQPLTNQIKIMAFDLNLSNSIKFLGSISEVNELIMDSDLVVHSSNTEGCPNSVCEAMALGKAVIATDITGDREAVSDKFEDWTLSKPNDPNDLSNKLIRLLENPDKCAEIGTYNQQRIANVYTLDGMIETLFSRFVNVL